MVARSTCRTRLEGRRLGNAIAFRVRERHVIRIAAASDSSRARAVAAARGSAVAPDPGDPLNAVSAGTALSRRGARLRALNLGSCGGVGIAALHRAEPIASTASAVARREIAYERKGQSTIEPVTDELVGGCDLGWHAPQTNNNGARVSCHIRRTKGPCRVARLARWT